MDKFDITPRPTKYADEPTQHFVVVPAFEKDELLGKIGEAMRANGMEEGRHVELRVDKLRGKQDDPEEYMVKVTFTAQAMSGKRVGVGDVNDVMDEYGPDRERSPF